MLKEAFAQYKRFEKCFFKEDKTKDLIIYIRLKHQFRSMMCLSMVAFLTSIYILISRQAIPTIGLLLISAVLFGFRTRSYFVIRLLFFVLMMLSPLRYISSPLVLLTPIILFQTAVQILVQTHSHRLVWLHLAIQSIGFYFYGVDQIAATIKGLSHEELAESVRTVVLLTFFSVALSVFCMKIFYSQFSSLLRKVSTLTESLSKANNQLNDQNLKLQSNLEMKDVFIYTFSHELKNALNGLLGNLTLAYDFAKNTQAIQHLTSAKVCGEILKNFIHNILDSGKLENGNLEVSPERKDVMSFMQSMWSICGKIIQNKRLKGALDIEKNVPAFLDLDEQRMIQIILNLVSNAVKFTEKGQVRIHISWQTISVSSAEPEEQRNQIQSSTQDQLAEEIDEEKEAIHHEDTNEFPEDQEAPPSRREIHLGTEYYKKFIDGSQSYQLNLTKSHWDSEEVLSSVLPAGSKGTLKIQVLDTGCGMPPEDQAMLFQKFSQVSSIQDQRKVGTGLGLWICKELANRLDGDIITRSMVGVGSVFELKIKARVSDIPPKSRNGRHSRGQHRAGSPTRKLSLEYRGPNTLKILVADDDSFNIELMKNYLNKFGIDHICAYDGEEAVSLFKKHYKEICFVITDNFMPKKTGTEAAIEITRFLEEKKHGRIPIMCISGDLKVSVNDNGITSVIQKPINFNRLKEELMAVYPQITDGGDL